MSFTILGATGVIGSRLVAWLRSQGEEVYAPGRDIPDMIKRPLGHVIYAIGLTADFRSRPFQTVEAHVSVLSKVLQHADFSSLLYLSSTRVYANSSSGSEDTPLHVNPQDPSDLYNLSKLMGESLCLSCGHPEVRIARLSNVVGGESQDSDNFIPSLLRAAQEGRIVLRTSLSSSKDYIHIDDVVELLPRIATQGRARMYNVASGIQTTHAQWINHLAGLTGCHVEVAPNAPATTFAPIDVTRIRTEFDFVPRPVFSALPAIIERSPGLHPA